MTVSSFDGNSSAKNVTEAVSNEIPPIEMIVLTTKQYTTKVVPLGNKVANLVGNLRTTKQLHTT